MKPNERDLDKGADACIEYGDGTEELFVVIAQAITDERERTCMAVAGRLRGLLSNPMLTVADFQSLASELDPND